MTTTTQKLPTRQLYVPFLLGTQHFCFEDMSSVSSNRWNRTEPCTCFVSIWKNNNSKSRSWFLVSLYQTESGSGFWHKKITHLINFRLFSLLITASYLCVVLQSEQRQTKCLQKFEGWIYQELWLITLIDQSYYFRPYWEYPWTILSCYVFFNEVP